MEGFLRSSSNGTAKLRRSKGLDKKRRRKTGARAVKLPINFTPGRSSRDPDTVDEVDRIRQ